MKKWLFLILALIPGAGYAAPATDAQVQRFVDERIRVRSEAIRKLYLLIKDDKAVIDDVYDAVEPVESATWADNRTDGPPHLATPANVLSYNTFADAFIAFIEGGATSTMDDAAAQYPIIQDLCVRPPGSE